MKCITFDKDALDALPDLFETEKRAEYKATKCIKFCEKIAKLEKGCAPSAGYMQELIEDAENALK